MVVNSIDIVDPEEWMIDYLAERLRDEDIKNAIMAGQENPSEGLRMSWQDNEISGVAMWRGRPIACFGVCRRLSAGTVLMPNTFIWMVGTNELKETGVLGARKAILHIEELTHNLGDVWSYIMDDFTVAKMFAKSLGFTETSVKISLSEDKTATAWSKRITKWGSFYQ